MVTLIIVGMPGAGQDVLVQAALELGFGKISMGDTVRHHAKLAGIGSGDMSIGGFASSERELHGPAVWAERTLAMMPPGNVIIDGSRSIAEIARFREALGMGLKVIAVTAPRDVRFQRLMQRGRQDDPSSIGDFERRDARELSWGLGEAIGSADLTLENAADVGTFRGKCRTVLQSIIGNARQKGSDGKSI